MKKKKSMLTTAIAVGALVMQGMVSFAQTGVSTELSMEAIRPFHVNVPKKELSDLKRRVSVARLPDKETVADQSQGVQLATIQKLTQYWAKDYDWRKAEAKLNALPQFITRIDGVDIHFIHVRSKEPNALPIIITHGWPGSIFEELKLIGPLTDPVAYGGKAEDAFDVVIPSIPGYGFSGKPSTTGWNTDRIAHAWDTLMKRLGYTHYVAQGGDWGAKVSEALAHQAPQGLLGVHMNLLLTLPPEVNRAVALGEPAPESFTEEEKMAYNQRKALNPIGYLVEQVRRPQTIGYSLAESPVGLAAWLLDHDPHSYELLANAFQGQPDGDLTRDEFLDNITLYWLTNTGTSAARLYWENSRVVYKGDVSVPVAFSVFPGELWHAPRSWVNRAFKNLIYYHEVDKGGHFAAWEQPQLFAEELRASFKSLR
jgi:pimeloyl-ACP methyl ester carboxylesterase